MFQNLFSLRSKYQHLEKNQFGLVVDNEEALEFRESALGYLKSAEIGETILNMLTGSHPLHSKSIYEMSEQYCSEAVKDYFNGLIQVFVRRILEHTTFQI